MAADSSAAVGKLSPPPTAPHVLLVPLPFQGHITPFLELGRRLAASGLRVTFLTTHHIHAKLLRSLAMAQQQQPTASPLLSFASLPDSLPDGALAHELLQATERGLEDAAPAFLLSLAAEGHPVTCVISDFSLSCSLASQAGLPEFLLAVHCLLMFAIDLLHIDAFVSADSDPFDAADCQNMESSECIGGAGVPRQHLRYPDKLYRDANWELSMAWHQQRVRQRFLQISSYKGLLVNSSMALEGEVYKAIAAADVPVPHPLLRHAK